GLGELKICRAYRIDGKETAFFPANVDRLEKCECIYETLPGWSDDLSEVRDFGDLPLNARNYITVIEELVKAAVTMIGVGPKRSQTIFRD
ncbi:MAG: adenylosuccinate synthetase, partial [Phycisphaerae bacterium]|nr:adenylosuccinate synthetase [Phycisphaerae bacterium]